MVLLFIANIIPIGIIVTSIYFIRKSDRLRNAKIVIKLPEGDTPVAKRKRLLYRIGTVIIAAATFYLSYWLGHFK